MDGAHFEGFASDENDAVGHARAGPLATPNRGTGVCSVVPSATRERLPWFPVPPFTGSVRGSHLGDGRLRERLAARRAAAVDSAASARENDRRLCEVRACRARGRRC